MSPKNYKGLKFWSNIFEIDSRNRNRKSPNVCINTFLNISIGKKKITMKIRKYFELNIMTYENI